MNYSFRKACVSDIKSIMAITKDAKKFLKDSGSTQWNEPDGYPLQETFETDINNGNLYVLLDNDRVIGYEALIRGLDRSYINIEGAWLSDTNDYLTIHRIAVDKDYRGKHVSKCLVEYAIGLAKELGVSSLKGDTHRLNIPMQKLFLSQGFKYCGKIELENNNFDNKRMGYELLIK